MVLKTTKRESQPPDFPVEFSNFVNPLLLVGYNPPRPHQKGKTQDIKGHKHFLVFHHLEI